MRTNPSLPNASTQHEVLQNLRQLVKEGQVNLSGAKGKKIPIPRPVAGLLDEILKNLQAGKNVSVVPEHEEISTQKAANLLGVSRPFLVQMLEQGEIPFHMAGSHRRVHMQDVLAYKAKRDKKRHASIVRMARMEKRAGTYDKVVLPTGA